MTGKKIAFLAAETDEAQEALKSLKDRYQHAQPEDAEVIVALGGDGFMLATMHGHMQLNLPIYGMNKGTIGFLMNDYSEDGLLERLGEAESTALHPLHMTATTAGGESCQALAFNEVSLLRQTRLAAKVEISVDGRVRLNELVCDGVLVATAAGSSAYNLSAHGPVLPIDSKILALTPISAFRPRRWRGALLPHDAKVRFKILEHEKRPASVTADHIEFRDVTDVHIREDRETSVRLLFDRDHSLEERILLEQFVD